MIKQVVVDTSGGKVVGPAIPIEVLTAAQAAGRPIEAKQLRVVAFTDADVAAGRIKCVGGRPIPVVLGDGSPNNTLDGPAIPVVVVSGSLTPPASGLTALVVEGALTALVIEGTLTALVLE